MQGHVPSMYFTKDLTFLNVKACTVLKRTIHAFDVTYPSVWQPVAMLHVLRNMLQEIRLVLFCCDVLSGFI